jgi:hypothetical protein
VKKNPLALAKLLRNDHFGPKVQGAKKGVSRDNSIMTDNDFIVLSVRRVISCLPVIFVIEGS